MKKLTNDSNEAIEEITEVLEPIIIQAPKKQDNTKLIILIVLLAIAFLLFTLSNNTPDEKN